MVKILLKSKLCTYNVVAISSGQSYNSTNKMHITCDNKTSHDTRFL